MAEAQDIRARLVEGAVRLVDEYGAERLQVRKLAAAVGTSTMAVYTYFSGMAGILAEVRTEGYRRLAANVGAVADTADPVADLVSEALAYRQTAVDGPHLFALAFGDPEVGGSKDRVDGSPVRDAVFSTVLEMVARAADAGRIDPSDQHSAAAQLWTAQHGVVMLEMSGFLGASPERVVDDVLVPQAVSLAIGFGDDPAAARRSGEIGRANWERIAAAR